MDLTAWAERFIETPSVSQLGNQAIAQAACELLAELGIAARIETAEVAGVRHHALIADLGPQDADEGLLLVTHLATVPPGENSAWTATGGDPYRPTRGPTADGDLLYGLGSADAKVDFVCKAAGLGALDASKLHRRVRLVGTFAEEIGLLGARWLVDQGLTQGFRFALVGEPSELVAIHAHKGYAVFEARVSAERLGSQSAGRLEAREFEGHSAHSSTPQLGGNAIEAALERLARPDVMGFRSLAGGGAVNKVPDRCMLEAWVAAPGAKPQESDARAVKPLLEFHAGWRELLADLEGTRDGDFDPDHTVGSLGRVEPCEGGVAFYFDLRPVPGVDPREAVRPLESLAELRCVRANPPLATPLDSPLVEAITNAQRELGLGRRIGTKATCTEAGLLASQGMDAIVIGAGTSVGNVHRPNEHTRISDLELARELYRSVISWLCIGGDGPCT